jgi:hypothetical protein
MQSAMAALAEELATVKTELEKENSKRKLERN